MKKIIALFIAVAVMLSIAVPVTAGAATAKVSDLTQTMGNTSQFEFTWSAILGENVKYHIEVSEDGSAWEDYGDTTGNSKRISDVQSGKSYYVRVRAEKNGEYGEYSDAFEVVTAPNDTANVIQTAATTSTATITWDAVKGATEYAVCEWIDGDYVYDTTTDTTYTFKGLKNNEKFPYDVFVRTVRVSESGFKASYIRGWHYMISNFQVSSGLKLVPKKMTTPKVTSYLDSIGVIYTETGSVPGMDGCDIKIYDGKKVIDDNDGWRHEVTGGKFLSIKARAYVNIGPKGEAKYGKWSDAFYFVNGGVSISATGGNKKISASWSKIKGATNYTVYIAKAGNKNFKKVKTLKGRSLKITKIGKKKLKKNTAYDVKVVANKKVGKKTFKSVEKTFYSVRTK